MNDVDTSLIEVEYFSTELEAKKWIATLFWTEKIKKPEPF